MEVLKPFCLWFTGLSGAGKSTLSECLHQKFEAELENNIELLDGDVVRTNLSKGLGFSREDRDINVLRIGWVCQLLVKHQACVMTAAISPYRETRDQVRAMVEEAGGEGAFIEVFVDASVDACAKRDVKGLYAKAKRGEIPEFTGVSDPYEPPINSEVHALTDNESLEESAAKVLEYLIAQGYIRA